MLTEKAIRAAKPREKEYLIADINGLYLRVTPKGNKSWIYRLRSNGKEKRTSIGLYPETSLKQARVIASAKEKEIIKPKQAIFGEVLSEWQKHILSRKSGSYVRSLTYKINKYLPPLYEYQLDEITPRILINLLREIEAKGYCETAHRVRILISQVYDYAVILGETERNPAQLIAKALEPSRPKNFASLTDTADIKLLMASVKAYPYRTVRTAALFSIYTFCRQNEIRHALWSEISGNIWTIPAEKMKMKREHKVPLAAQCLELLKAIPRMSDYIFPSARDLHRPMSPDAIRIALRTMGFDKDKITPHGFRSMASTILNEHGFNKDIIELQLAHVDKDRIRAIYNRADYWGQRVEMVQWYADYLDKL